MSRAHTLSPKAHHCRLDLLPSGLYRRLRLLPNHPTASTANRWRRPSIRWIRDRSHRIRKSGCESRAPAHAVTAGRELPVRTTDSPCPEGRYVIFHSHASIGPGSGQRTPYPTRRRTRLARNELCDHTPTDPGSPYGTTRVRLDVHSRSRDRTRHLGHGIQSQSVARRAATGDGPRDDAH